MSDFFDKLTEKSKEIANAAKNTANDLIEKGKDKTEEFRLNGDMREAFVKLGELVYEQAVTGAEAAGRDELIAKITGIKEALKALADKAAAPAEAAPAAEPAAQETITCPICGDVLPKGTAFCPKCGAKLS